MRVVLIDDHGLIRESLAQWLRSRGVEVVASVGNGAEGVARAAALKPNLSGEQMKPQTYANVMCTTAAFLFLVFGCREVLAATSTTAVSSQTATTQVGQMKPISSIKEGIAQIRSYNGKVEDFRLLVPDSLNDPAGVTMAILGDELLAKGWFPNGYTRHEGYREYRFTDKPPIR